MYLTFKPIKKVNSIKIVAGNSVAVAANCYYTSFVVDGILVVVRSVFAVDLLDSDVPAVHSTAPSSLDSHDYRYSTTVPAVEAVAVVVVAFAAVVVAAVDFASVCSPPSPPDRRL